VAMRLELKQGIHRSMLVNDTYSADLPSLNIALDFLSQQAGKKRILILSDIYQSGKSDQQLYKEIAALVNAKGVDQLIAIGERIGAHRELFSDQATFHKDVAQFMAAFNPVNYRDSAVLIKGARDFAFERIAERLQEKAHETVLEVNLDALVHNMNYFKSLVRPETKLMVMVKASSYGAGNFEVANTLQYNRVDYLAVAYADEGVQLRERNVTVPIMVMNPESTAYDAMIRYRLEPEVYNFRTLHLFCDVLKNSEYAGAGSAPFPVHIKLDTGMRRLGFEASDLPLLIATLKQYEDVIRLVSVFSHLTSSGDQRDDEHSQRQIEQFERMSSQLISNFDYSVDRHILNTAGIMRFPQAQYEMVRLGIGLYGLAMPPHQEQLRAVSRMKTVVSQLKHIEPGDTVGYGRNYKATEKRTIATIPVGYADGLNRKLGGGKWKVKVNGVSASIIGDICMDMCMVDVSGIAVEEGDTVCIFETVQDLKSMAAALETIPYEIFTTISSRVKRVFYHE
jgi:alanine racemase